MIFIYVLDYCPYCNNSLKILNEFNIKHKKITVQDHEKDYYKKKNKMNTFPQIFLEIEKDKLVKIGGNSDLEKTLSICKFINESNIPIDIIYILFKKIYKKK